MRDAERHADFSAAYRDMFSACVGVITRLCSDPYAAEDVTAEALARAYANWGRVRTLRVPHAWVIRVATNLAVDAARHRALAARRQPLLVTQTPGGFEDPSEVVATRVALTAALARLPKRQREAVVLHYLAGLTEQEVSESLRISASSVRTHVQRGLSSLRGQLDGEVPRAVLG